MRFTLKQLRYVEAAGRRGSVVSAAAEMAISQSSITAALDALEAELGVDLFVRMPAKGIIPTPTGRKALELIRHFLEQSRHFESDLRSLYGGPSGTLHIACYVTTAPHLLPILLRSFLKRFPNIGIDLFEGDLASVSQALATGEVDVACTYEVPASIKKGALAPDIDFFPLFTAYPHAIVPQGDPLADKESVGFAELAERPMVMLDLPYARDYMLGLFRQRGINPRIAHSSRSSESVRALVSSGFGFAIMNMRPAGPDQAGSLVHLPISDDVGEPRFGLATLAGVKRPVVVDTFLDHAAGLAKAGSFSPLVVGRPPAGAATA